MQQVTEAQLRRLISASNPKLSKYNPLPTIVFFDDFNLGMNGWLEVIGNFTDSVDNVTRYPEIMDSRPPMLSTAVMPDTGSQGALSGAYSMKIATRPHRDHVAKGLKRLTFRHKGLVRCETYFTFKPEATELVLGDTDVKAFGMSYDLQDDDHRYWPAIRFLNAEDGTRVEKWQYHVGGKRLPHLDGWEDVPAGAQALCYNETDTKQNWHYLSWTVDLATRQYVDLRCNDLSWDLSGKAHEALPEDPDLRGLMNLGVFVENNRDKRSMVYLDSVVLSVEEEVS